MTYKKKSIIKWIEALRAEKYSQTKRTLNDGFTFDEIADLLQLVYVEKAL